MKARLRVLSGGSAGKELKLKEGQFLIGRSDSCHLRPRSDAISRKHCVLFIEKDKIRARDLKSRNGTLVNGEKIVGDVELKSGDEIAVGPLKFEIIMVAESAPAAPQPAPTPAKAKSTPTASKPSTTKSPAKAGASAKGGGLGDDDIFGWLEEADEVDREQRLTDPSTRHFKVGDGDQAPSEPNVETVDIAKASEKGSDTSVGKKAKKEKKKEPGKLPPVPENLRENSQDAAADALKQFFKRS
jgi:predicted component of type VI protein secretion system